MRRLRPLTPARGRALAQRVASRGTRIRPATSQTECEQCAAPARRSRSAYCAAAPGAAPTCATPRSRRASTTRSATPPGPVRPGRVGGRCAEYAPDTAAPPNCTHAAPVPSNWRLGRLGESDSRHRAPPRTHSPSPARSSETSSTGRSSDPA